MRIEKCSFCGCNVYPGHGQVFVRNDCKTFRFCRSKCKKNFALKRNPMKVRWTKTFRRAANKELTMDRTLQFEEKRNVPVRYDRELVQASVDAMKRIAHIRERRAAEHWKKRMEVKEVVETREGIRDLQRNLDMVEDPALREHARKVMLEGEKHLRLTAKKGKRHEAVAPDAGATRSSSADARVSLEQEKKKKAGLLLAQSQDFTGGATATDAEAEDRKARTGKTAVTKKVSIKE